MCGIAGYFSTDLKGVNRNPIEPMLTIMKHRGPDGFGIFVDKDCVLGHARLSIIDIEGGWQPMFNEDNRFVITFNGEIYNYLELRTELESKGHIFKTKSDTEVIVHSYEEWGKDCPKRFNGQFSFAIHDRRQKSLFICRDRLGVRPFYYAWNGKLFVFASEVKAILASSLVSPKLSVEGLDQIFVYWSNVFPCTPFKNIFELPPSHTMEISSAGVSMNRYWEVPNGAKENRSERDCIEGILHHLNRSIRLRLRADVPVAAYISGGLDSGLTTALIRKWTDTYLKSFSLEFEDPRFDESSYQLDMVRSLGTDHSSIRCRYDDIVDNFEDAVWAAERPLLRTAPVPMLLLSRLVRSEGYKVVITGEGADEFFCGYDIFKETKVRHFCSKQPGSKIRPHLLRRLYPYLFEDPRTAKFQEAFFLRRYMESSDPFYGHRLRWGLGERIRDFYTAEARSLIDSSQESMLAGNLPTSFGTSSPVDRAQQVEIETLLTGYLLSSQGDRVSMANSVEGRYPFLDHELIEFVSRIPAEQKMPGLQEKHLLKKIGESMLPSSVINRKKFPYRAPGIESFLRTTNGREQLLASAAKGKISEGGIFDHKAVAALLSRILSDPQKNVTTTDNLVLMAVHSARIFHEKFLFKTIEGRPFSSEDNVRTFHIEEGKC